MSHQLWHPLGKDWGPKSHPPVRLRQRRRIDLSSTALRLLAAVPDSLAYLRRPGLPLESLVEPRKRIRLSQSGLPAQVLTVLPLSAPQVGLDRVIRTSTSSRGLWVKALGSCEHGPFLTAFKAPTFGVLGWPNRALGHHPVVEVPVTQLLRDPMQENQERFLLTLPMLAVLADASSFPQSDVLTPVVRLQPNTECLKHLADFFGRVATRRHTVSTMHHPTRLQHTI